MSKAPFAIDPVLTGAILAYRNLELIADSVLPRLVPIAKEEFTYTLMTKAEGFTIPDTKVGRKGEPNEVEFTGTRVTGRTEDYGLDDFVPFNDVQNAPAGYDPEAYAAVMLEDLVQLDREVRVANTVFAQATYPASNRVTLAGNQQWSDFVNSDPIADITTALDTPIVRPNVAVFGRQAFSTLSRHPKIAKAVLGNSGDVTIATRKQIAELFELEEVLVGASYVNTAKPGQAATMARVWGKHAAFIRRDKLVQTTDDKRVTFGFTVQYGQKVAGRIPEPKKGLRGGTRVRVGESVAEVISAADVGYFVQNAIA